VKLTLRYLRVFALDWERLTDFYESAVGLPVRYKNSDMGWAEFDVGEASLAVERVRPEDAEAEALTRRFLGVSLAVDDIQSAYATLRDRNVHFLAPPAQQPWGGWLAHFQDPEGNVLTLLGTADQAGADGTSTHG
jgi:predicted enzyme related to lactoylglutathione lyase